MDWQAGGWIPAPRPVVPVAMTVLRKEFRCTRCRTEARSSLPGIVMRNRDGHNSTLLCLNVWLRTNTFGLDSRAYDFKFETFNPQHLFQTPL